jgi:hypothetical protein
MPTFYQVTTTVSDNGETTSEITAERECNTIPDSTVHAGEFADTMKDWFPTQDAAQHFISIVKGYHR